MRETSYCPHLDSAADYPFGPVRGLELHDRYLELMREQPVSRVRMPYGGEAWLITGYPELRQFLADPSFSSTAATEPDTPRVTPLPLRLGGLLTMDAPEHTRIRRVVAKAFTKRQVDRLRDRIQEVADTLVDRMAAQGPPADLVEDLAVPLPVVMICELFGIPYERRERFRRYSDVFISTFAHTREEIDEARSELENYIGELIEWRRREPSDDVVSMLVEAMDVERLSAAEAARTGVGVLMAGHDTSLSMISNVCYLLMSRPELYTQLRTNPELMDTAVEEFLRVIPLRSVGSFPRRATKDVEIGGVLIRAGDTVIFQRAAADRDERVFDKPHKLDLARKVNPHLGFGHGVHFCLGAQLAKAELTIAIKGLIRAFPGLRLAVPAAEVAWKPGHIARCPRSLLVLW
jgi:cytochrome P450